MTKPPNTSGGLTADHITAAAYGRACEPPIGKSGMARLIALGLPVHPGTDGHGRVCKFVLPAEADEWRRANCTAKPDKDGRMRGPPDFTPSATARTVAADASSPAPGSAPRPASAKAGPSSPRGGASTHGDEGEGGGYGVGTLSVGERTQLARMREAEERAESATLRRLTAEGRLLDREAAIDAHLAFVGQVGTAIDRMPADHATTVASALGVTEHQAYLVLRKVGERLREDLARYAASEGERLAIEAEDGDDAPAGRELSPEPA